MADYTDNFDRADSFALGASWVESESSSAALIIASNRLGTWGGGRRGYAYWNAAFNNDQYSQLAHVSSPGYEDKQGPAVRASGTYDSFTGYVAVYDSVGTPTIRLFKYVDASLNSPGTSLGTYVQTLIGGDLFRIEAVGNSISVFVNGVQRISVTDSDIATGRGGVAIVLWALSEEVARWDDWAGGDAEAPPPPPSGGFHHQVMQV